MVKRLTHKLLGMVAECIYHDVVTLQISFFFVDKAMQTKMMPKKITTMKDIQ